MVDKFEYTTQDDSFDSVSFYNDVQTCWNSGNGTSTGRPLIPNDVRIDPRRKQRNQAVIDARTASIAANCTR